MRNNFETITTADKQKRDAMYDELRASDNAQERQVVKFSDCEPTGEKELVWFGKKRAGQKDKEPEVRNVYRSTWSVAYPKSDV
jgi:hypothetical protein